MRALFLALALSFAAGALADAQSSPLQPASPPASLSSPPAGGLSSGGFGQPLRPLGSASSIVGLPAAGDQAPQCRATCAKVRYTCGDDDPCAQNWRQCVRACGATP